MNGASDYTELAKCIDDSLEVIDSNGCYLTPRAVQQYVDIFGLTLDEVEEIINQCYEDNLGSSVNNYQQYYQCIQGA